MSGRFDIVATSIPDLVVLKRKPVSDHRGMLERLFAADELSAHVGLPIVQINRTRTAKRGTVRGMHFQLPPHAEIKIVTCLRGAVFDVAVDLRRGSPTFLRWHAERLTEDSGTSLVIPRGFAHGFQALSDNAELLYFHTANYEPSSESAVNARDARVAIQWPEPIVDISERDASHAMLSPDYAGIQL
jgi:dTDP-4-dehydrorhamnose 3,5-epimerase